MIKWTNTLYMPFFTIVDLALIQGITIQCFVDSSKRKKFHTCLTEKRKYVNIHINIYIYIYIYRNARNIG